MEWQITPHHIWPKVRMTRALLAARSATFQSFLGQARTCLFMETHLRITGCISTQKEGTIWDPINKQLTSQKKTNYRLKPCTMVAILCIRIGIGQDTISMSQKRFGQRIFMLPILSPIRIPPPVLITLLSPVHYPHLVVIVTPKKYFCFVE